MMKEDDLTFVGRSFYQSKFKHKNPKVSKNIVGFDF